METSIRWEAYAWTQFWMRFILHKGVVLYLLFLQNLRFSQMLEFGLHVSLGLVVLLPLTLVALMIARVFNAR